MNLICFNFHMIINRSEHILKAMTQEDAADNFSPHIVTKAIICRLFCYRTASYSINVLTYD